MPKMRVPLSPQWAQYRYPNRRFRSEQWSLFSIPRTVSLMCLFVEEKILPRKKNAHRNFWGEFKTGFDSKRQRIILEAVLLQREVFDDKAFQTVRLDVLFVEPINPFPHLLVQQKSDYRSSRPRRHPLFVEVEGALL